MAHSVTEVAVLANHLKGNICSTRPKYREGRKDTAVKVYTINQESCFLIIQNVPAVGTREELRAICEQYGFVDDMKALDDYPSDEFTEVYLVKYANFFAARTAKKQLDDKSFFGGILHVCYAPEFESVEDTKRKLVERRKFVAAKTRPFLQPNEESNSSEFKSYQKRKTYAHEATSNNTDSKKPKLDSQCMTYIWAGKEYSAPIASSTDIQTRDFETEIAIRQKQFSQKKNTELSAEQLIPPHDIIPNFEVTDPQCFIPRQLSHKGQTLAKRNILEHNKISIQSSVEESKTAEAMASNYSYDKTMDEIRKKLSQFSGANLNVSLKGKR